MPTSQTVSTTARLTSLRSLMSSKEHSIDVFIVPSEDQHASEYLAACDERRAFISGFTGSAGCAIVTQKEALLFTDGRYFLQASQQLDENWTLMKTGLPGVPTWQEYINKHLEKSTRVGIDPTLISAEDAKGFKKSLSEQDSTLIELSNNPIDEIWSSTSTPVRPERPKNKVLALEIKYAGKSSEEKISDLRKFLGEKKVQGMVVTMLDEVAWLFNLRGTDIPYNPVFFAYALITHQDVILYIHQSQVDDSVSAHLANGIVVKPYEAVFDDLKRFSESVSGKESIVVGKQASLAIANAIGEEKVFITRSPVADAKSIKNEVEMEGFRQCHIRDGAALARYFAWLEKQLKDGVTLSEYEGAEKLEGFRRELELFQGLSFTTISASGPSGAIIHYSPDEKESAKIQLDQIYLCDSGAQFTDGTTDVTRTWHFGTPSAEEKRAFTRVLQGHIAIDSLVFPDKTTGYILDAFARRSLWEDGLDYRHGTGHGVGHFLNVHEGPQGIGMRINYNDTPLKPGMVLSNEPGYYEDGKFGIRIENIVIVQLANPPNNFGGKEYYKFEHVTMSPMNRKLIEVDLLTVREKFWLNNYNKEVYEKVSPLLKDDPLALEWLERECQPL